MARMILKRSNFELKFSNLRNIEKCDRWRDSKVEGGWNERGVQVLEKFEQDVCVFIYVHKKGR